MSRSRAPSTSLASRASRALGWSFASNAVARLGSVPIVILLARLLGPHSFGTFAVALVALMAVLSFNDLGVSLAIVRSEGDPAAIVPTVATLSVAASLITYLGCFLAAPSFSSAMGAPAAVGVIRVLALNVIVDGFTATPVALMQRYFSQNRKAVADQVYTWLGGVLSLVLVWRGFGAMGMAIGWVAGAVAAAILYWGLCPEPVRFGFDPDKVRELCRFGLPLAGSSIVVFGVTNVDQFVVGHLLGTTALGYYALALNLATWPVNMFSWPTRAIVPAVFSRLQQDRQAMSGGFVSMARLLGSATLPACALIGGAAVPLVGFVYGARWVPAAQALSWLAVVGALRILFEFVYDFFVVLARTRVVFTVQVVWLAALVPALILGARADGISGAALGEVAVAACVVLPWYLSELSKTGVLRRSLLAQLWLPFAAAVVVTAAASLASRYIRPELAVLAVSGTFALATTGALGYGMRREIAALLADFRQRPAVGPGAGVELARDAAGVAPAGSAGGIAHPGRTADSGWAGGTARPGPAPWTAATGSPVRPGPAARRGDLSAAAVLTAAILNDVTGPLPIYRDAAAALRWRPSESLPAYRDTVRALGWDPAKDRPGRHAR
jgi:O-antigen/teichoic acid export membrane protein